MQKSEIDRLINIWLDSELSLSNDAGWSGDSLLSRIIEFGGQPPRGTGNDQSNSTMIAAIHNLRPAHHDYPRINSAVKSMLHAARPKILALLAKHYYRGLNAQTGRIYLNQDRAVLINQSPRQYERNLSSGYRQLIAQLTTY